MFAKEEVQEKVSYEAATPEQKMQIGLEAARESNAAQKKIVQENPFSQFVPPDPNSPYQDANKPKRNMPVQESREGDSWEEEFYEAFKASMIGGGAGKPGYDSRCTELTCWIRTKKGQWYQETFDRITIECEEHREAHVAHGRTLALQEAASTVRGMKDIGLSMHGNCCTCQDCKNPHDECSCERNQALEDAAREIEAKAKDSMPSQEEGN